MHGKVQGTQSAITVHGDGARVHGKVQGTGAERDRGRCLGAREGAGRDRAERDNGARACTGRCMQGTGAASDNGAWGRCTGAQGKVQGTRAERDNGARVKGTGAERDNGARGRCTGAREGAERGPGQSAITVHGDGAREGAGGRGRAR